MICELPEQGLITNLCSLHHNTIGPKKVANGLCVGYNNGLIEIRDISDGKVLYSNTGLTNTTTSNNPIAGFVYGDFSNNGEYSLIELSVDGKVTIYKKTVNYDYYTDYQNKIYECTKKKQDLLLELKTLKERSLTISSNAFVLSKEMILDSFVNIDIIQEFLDEKSLNGQIVLLISPKENVTIEVVNVTSDVLFEDNTFTMYI
ncbi:hypothetical protein PIROE2DRAFT_10240 [Piromyces sp. E2]|nr:hypothetical protein PIROE2DRAFT_10240 [Piromyces sp. E2]|eukprot:OUM63271.1 hypothetical protein PIROE2DRAFT_10240 [Piromyces sp. E2]